MGAEPPGPRARCRSHRSRSPRACVFKNRSDHHSVLEVPAAPTCIMPGLADGRMGDVPSPGRSHCWCQLPRPSASGPSAKHPPGRSRRMRSWFCHAGWAQQHKRLAGIERSRTIATVPNTARPTRQVNANHLAHPVCGWLADPVARVRSDSGRLSPAEWTEPAEPPRPGRAARSAEPPAERYGRNSAPGAAAQDPGTIRRESSRLQELASARSTHIPATLQDRFEVIDDPPRENGGHIKTAG